MKNLINISKFILAILLFICLLDMSYGYFIFVRYIALIGFAFLALKASQNEMQTEMLIYIALAILFQPLFKIALGRQIWNIVDIIVGLSLIISIYLPVKVKSKK